MTKVSSGYGFVALAAFCWSLMTLLSKILFAAGLSPLEVSFWRASFGCLCFGLHAASSRALSIRPSHVLLFMAWGMMSIGGLFYVFFMSMHYSGAAMGEILLYTAPVWVAIFSKFISHEVVTKQRWLAICIALCGVVCICFSGGSLQTKTSVTGIVCGLASGFCYALQYPFFKHWQKYYRTEVLYTYMQLGGVGSVALHPFPYPIFGTDMACHSDDRGLHGLCGLLGLRAEHEAHPAGPCRRVLQSGADSGDALGLPLFGEISLP